MKALLFALAGSVALFAAYSAAVFFHFSLALPADEPQRSRMQYDCCAWFAIFCFAAAIASAMLFFIVKERVRRRALRQRGFEVLPLATPADNAGCQEP
jgi:hypothetical protein